MHPAEVVIAEFGSLVELLANHLDEITILHAMAGENAVEIFPAAVIPWQTTPLIADCEFAEAEKVGIV
jgi:hypothetical protein